MSQVDQIRGETFHGRKGAVTNASATRWTMCCSTPRRAAAPRLFSRNRANLMSLHDSDHGGAPGEGGAPPGCARCWRRTDFPATERILLLAQPRVLGHVFNPVSLLAVP